VYIATYNTTYGYGVSLAETERKSSGTGMTDDFPKLTYKDDSGLWPDWPGMNCVDHNAFELTRRYSWNYNTTGEDAVWVGGEGASELYRVDPVSDTIVARIPFAGQSIAAGNGFVWLVDYGTRQPGIGVTRIDPGTNYDTGEPLVIDYEPGNGRFGHDAERNVDSLIAVSQGALWVADPRDGEIIRIELVSR